MNAYSQLTTVAASTVSIVDAPAVGKVRIVNTVTFYNPTGGGAVNIWTRVSPGTNRTWSANTVLAGSSVANGRRQVLTAGTSLQGFASASTTCTAHFIEEDDSEEHVHRHDFGRGTPVLTIPPAGGYTTIVATPPAGKQHIIRDLTIANHSGVAITNCNLSIQTAGPTENIFHISGLIAGNIVESYSGMICITPGQALTGACDGFVAAYATAHYAVHTAAL